MINDTGNPNGITLPTVEVRDMDVDNATRAAKEKALSDAGLAMMDRMQTSNGYGRQGMGAPYSVDPSNGRFGQDESKAPPPAGIIGKAQDADPLA